MKNSRSFCVSAMLAPTETKMLVHVELSGGLELLFKKKTQHTIELDEKEKETYTIADLLEHMKDKVISEQPHLFVQDGTVRPGILVLINEVDWELEGGVKYQLKNDDKIVFISTLHGG